jgi:DNA ligase-1
MEKQTRYTIDSSDRVRIWNCWYGMNDGGNHGMFTQDGIEGGKMKDPTFKEAEEKNVGRANYMSCEDQAKAMVEQAVGKKERKNYFSTISDARSKKIFKPMLAHKYEDKGSKLTFPVASQAKLDGGRCNVYWCPIAEQVVIRTRSTKDYNSVPHILDELIEMCEENRNLIIDGELYNHELHSDFEQVMSLIRQSKPTSEDLRKSSEMVEFHVYDVYVRDVPNMTFDKRWAIIKAMSDDDYKMIKFVPTSICSNQEELDEKQEWYLENNYEGQMVRSLDSIYKVDGRSNDLLKRKEFSDDEYRIVDVIEGTGGWTGAAKKIVILLPDGRTQGCGIDGSYERNKEILENKDDYINGLATVRYFRYTKDGFLYIPVCKDINRHD